MTGTVLAMIVAILGLGVSTGFIVHWFLRDEVLSLVLGAGIGVTSWATLVALDFPVATPCLCPGEETPAEIPLVEDDDPAILHQVPGAGTVDTGTSTVPALGR